MNTTQDQLAELIYENFRGRRTAYAIRQKNSNNGGKYPYNPARSPDKSDLPFTAEAIMGHLSGANTIGIYPIEAGSDNSQLGVFDLDDHGGSAPWAEMLAKSEEILNELARRGLAAIRFRSRGGRGIHIWILFDTPVHAASLRRFMQDILSEGGLREGSEGGLAAGVCEIFPKQDKVAPGGYGNLVALPLAGQSAPITDSGDLLPEDRWMEFFQALPVNRGDLIPVPAEITPRPVGRPPKSLSLDAHPLEACKFVQYCRKNANTLSEPLWFGLSSNCGVVEGGDVLFHEISSLDTARYNAEEAEAKLARSQEAKAPHRCETLASEGFRCPNMDPGGRCKVHGGRAPAVFAQDPKARIQFIKKQKNLHVTAKQEAISKIVLDDLCHAGHFYRTRGDDRQLFFHEVEKRLYELEGPNFRAFCNESYDINGSTSLWKFCLDDIQAHCNRNGVETETYRFSRWQEERLYIHAGEQDVFRLDGRTVETVSNGTDGVLFEDSGVEPIEVAENYEGSPIREYLVDELNCQESTYKDLLEAYIYSLFFEALLPTKPILLMHGPKGSGKTSKVRAIKKALFGQHADVSTGLTKSEGDALAAITHNHFLIADNVDGMVRWLGNLLASVATGTEIAIRTLYQTNALSTFTPRCFLAITSRDPLSFKRDDLADRLFIINVERHSNFIPESVIYEQIEINRAAIWAELLDKLNRIIRRVNQGGLPTTSKHRLADWARLVTVIGGTLELKDYAQALDHLDQARRDFVLEDNAIYEGIQKWVDAGKWNNEDGSPRELATGKLYNEITDFYGITHSTEYPIRSARKFGVELRQILPELSSSFDISIREGHARKKYVTISPLGADEAWYFQ